MKISNTLQTFCHGAYAIAGCVGLFFLAGVESLGLKEQIGATLVYGLLGWAIPSHAAAAGRGLARMSDRGHR